MWPFFNHRLTIKVDQPLRECHKLATQTADHSGDNFLLLSIEKWKTLFKFMWPEETLFCTATNKNFNCFSFSSPVTLTSKLLLDENKEDKEWFVFANFLFDLLMYCLFVLYFFLLNTLKAFHAQQFVSGQLATFVNDDWINKIKFFF